MRSRVKRTSCLRTGSAKTRPKEETSADTIEEEIGNIAPMKCKNIPKKILNFIPQNQGEIYWTPDKELIVDGKIIRNTNIINLITHLLLCLIKLKFSPSHKSGDKSNRYKAYPLGNLVLDINKDLQTVRIDSDLAPRNKKGRAERNSLLNHPPIPNLFEKIDLDKKVHCQLGR
ncbi:hypothetical protein TNCV_3156031 [Trichonephila clavipes]|nr:hypothetical protein TNCV_3156031 [Trichonephila clavipes]